MGEKFFIMINVKINFIAFESNFKFKTFNYFGHNLNYSNTTSDNSLYSFFFDINT